jgi:SAM-dependent methyltransferase
MQAPRITVSSISRWFNSLDYQEAGAKKEGVYVSYSLGESGRLAEARHRFRKELKHRLSPNSSILEIGCATGANLKILKDAGHQVKGIDLSSEFAKKARELYEIDVSEGSLTSLDPERGRFDMILLYGTFVNLTAPVEQLRHIQSLLKENGEFCFNVPVSDSFIARMYGSRCWMFTPSGSHFPTVDGCRKALKQAGLEVTDFGMDYQAPTVSKILGLVGLKWLFPIMNYLGLASVAPPVPIPIPIVRRFWCRKASTGAPV